MAAMRSGGTFAEMAARSAEGFAVPDRVDAAAVRVLGQAAVVVYQADAAEFSRRDAAGGWAVARLDLLDLMLSLPHGLPVPDELLSAQERSMLQELPPGCVQVGSGTVIRHAVAPLRAELAVVPVRDWNRGLDRASRFAPFCARAVVLSQLPDDIDHLLIEATYYGIGVAVAGDRDVEVLADPQPFIRHYHKAAGWWFAEEIYGQVSGKGTTAFSA